MKKNVMMRVASVLLICVLLTSSVISGTFAKYVTKGEATDTARVAKFGVVVTGKTGADNEAFAKEYTKQDGSYAGGVTVQAAEKVVAPGTSGIFTNFAITGTPEVAVRVTYAPVITIENWYADTNNDGNVNDEYCPIIIFINDVPFYINGTSINDVAELVAAVNAEIVSKSMDYAPGTDLSTVANDDLNIRWAWAFEHGTPIQNDEFDTDLGNWELYGNPIPTITIDVTCTVTQID